MSDRDPFWVRHPFIAGGVAVIALVLCGWGGYAIKVALSPVKGAGDTILKNQDADNRIAAQKKFEILYNDILAKDKNLDILAATVKAHPNERIAQDNLDGAKMICNAAVADYNAESEKTLSKDWMRADLPSKITGSNPATDCKESGAQ